jgi:hypothetical protein
MPACRFGFGAPATRHFAARTPRFRQPDFRRVDSPATAVSFRWLVCFVVAVGDCTSNASRVRFVAPALL